MADDLKKTILVEFKSNYEDYQKQVVETAIKIEALKGEIANLKKADGDNTEAIEAAKTELRKQQQQYKEATKQVDLYTKAINANEGSQEQAKAIAAIYNKELDKQAGLIEKDAQGNKKLGIAFEETAKKAKNANDVVNQFNLESKRGYSNVGLYSQSLEQTVGQLGLLPGAAGTAAKSVQGLGAQFKALLANPIILLIAGIVAALTGLVKLFKSTDSGATEFAARMEQLKAILDVLRQRLLAIINTWKNIFTGNWTEAAKSFGDAIGVTGSQFSEATKAAYEYAYAIDSLNDAEDAYISKAAENRNKIAKLSFDAQDRRKTTEERRKALQEALEIGKEESEKEIKFAQERFDTETKNIAARYGLKQQEVKDFIALDDEQTKSAIANDARLAKFRNNLNDAKTKELEELYAKLIDADTKYYEENKRRIGKLSEFEDEIRKEKEEKEKATKEKRDKQLEAERKAQEELLKNREKYLDAEKAAEEAIEDFRKKLREKSRADRQKQAELDKQARAQNLENQLEIDLANTASEFEQQRMTLEVKRKAEVANAEKIGADILLINKKYSLKNEEIAKAEASARLGIYSSIAGAIATIFGEQTALGKAAAVAETTIQTWVGAQNAFAAGAKFSLALGYANAAAAVLVGLANVKKILSVNTNISKGGSSQQPTSGGIPRFVATRVNETSNTARGNINPITGGSSSQTVNNVNNTTGLTANEVKTIVENMPTPVVSVEDINKVSNRKKTIEVKSNIL